MSNIESTNQIPVEGFDARVAAAAHFVTEEAVRFQSNGEVNDYLAEETDRLNEFGLNRLQTVKAAHEAFHTVHVRELGDDYDPDSQVALVAGKLDAMLKREWLMRTHRLEEPEDQYTMNAGTLEARKETDPKLMDALATDLRFTEEEAAIALGAVHEAYSRIPRHAQERYAQEQSLKAAAQFIEQQTEHPLATEIR